VRHFWNTEVSYRVLTIATWILVALIAIAFVRALLGCGWLCLD
jgi:hypothetical protein